MIARLLVVALVAVALLPGLEDEFRNPPPAYAPSAFWWWFLGAPYNEGDVEAAIDALQDAGLGGFRITPVYSFPGAESGGPRYLSEGYRRLVAHAIEYARRKGMTPESLLGSGWPYGGPYIPPEMGAMQLTERVTVVDGPGPVVCPGELTASDGETIVAFQAARSSADGGVDPATVVDLTPRLIDGKLSAWDAPPGRWLLMAFVAAPTGMKVKRAAPGGEGLVLDHFRREALELHLRHNGDVQAPALQGLAAVSMDSWEVFGANWTPALPDEFARRRGYRLEPMIAALFLPTGEAGARVRYDFRRTISELALENFFTPLRDWAHGHAFETRIEAHGTPADILEAYGVNDTPEAETYGPPEHAAIHIRNRRLASSAAHLFGRRRTTSETFTWLRYPMFRETLADMKVAADATYLDGVNQINFHGVPFSPRDAAAPGYYLYAASFVSPGNTWWPYLPKFTTYLRRANYLLQQGEPVADVAVYVPTEDVWSDAFGTWYDLAGGIEERFHRDGTLDMLASLGRAGYTFDLINATRIEQGAASRYRAIVLSQVESIDPATLETLVRYREKGGLVLTVGEPPSHAPGLVDAAARDARVASLVARLYPEGSGTRIATHAAHALDPGNHPIGDVLRAHLAPDVVSPALGTELGFVHRQTPGEEIYFVANLTDRAVDAAPSFRVTGVHPLLFDAETGEVRPHCKYRARDGRTEVALSLGPHESVFVVFRSGEAPRCEDTNVDRVLTFSSSEATAEVAANGAFALTIDGRTLHALVDDLPAPLRLSGPWQLRMPGSEPRSLAEPVLWTRLAGLENFSGTAAYSTSVTLPPTWLRADARLILECDQVEGVLDVAVNGKSAGVAWKPPFAVDITPFAASKNTLELRVTNTLFNRMLTAKPLPAPYVPLVVGNPKPMPSGLEGAVRIRMLRTIRLVP